AVAESLSILATIEYTAGTPKLALPHIERALAIDAKTLPAGHPKVATHLEDLGRIHADLGRLHDPIAHYLRANAIPEQAVGPDHPSVANALLGLGKVYLRRGRKADAVPVLERALRIWSAGTAEPQLVAEARAQLERAKR